MLVCVEAIHFLKRERNASSTYRPNATVKSHRTLPKVLSLSGIRCLLLADDNNLHILVFVWGNLERRATNTPN